MIGGSNEASEVLWHSSHTPNPIPTVLLPSKHSSSTWIQMWGFRQQGATKQTAPTVIMRSTKRFTGHESRPSLNYSWRNNAYVFSYNCQWEHQFAWSLQLLMLIKFRLTQNCYFKILYGNSPAVDRMTIIIAAASQHLGVVPPVTEHHFNAPHDRWNSTHWSTWRVFLP